MLCIFNGLLQEQYKFLHEVVFEALCSTNEPVPCDDFQSEYHRLMEMDPASNKTNLLLEYEVSFNAVILIFSILCTLKIH